MGNYSETLPCGKTIGDYLWERGLPYQLAEAVRLEHYLVEAKKDPQLVYDEEEWLQNKMISFVAEKRGKTYQFIENQVKQYYYDAITWNGRALR